MSEIKFKEPCGGCGQEYASKRCFGCHHEAIDWNRRTPLSALPGEAEVAGAPLVPPIRENPEVPAWLQMNNLFTTHRLNPPPTRLRDELVTFMEWAWYGQKLQASLHAMQARAEKAERERDALREALKPSGETKAEYIGEFTIAVERYVNSDGEVDDEGEGAMDPYEHVTVPWTTIKEIMAAISERAARTAITGGSNG